MISLAWMEQIYNYIRIGFSNKSIRVDGDKLYMLKSEYVRLFSVGNSFRSVDNDIRDRFGKEYLCIYNSSIISGFKFNEYNLCQKIY